MIPSRTALAAAAVCDGRRTVVGIFATCRCALLGGETAELIAVEPERQDERTGEMVAAVGRLLRDG